MHCPTIRVKGTPSDGNPSGIITINQSDYDLNPSAYKPVSVAPATVSAEVEVAEVSAEGDEGGGKKRRR